jgi:hypothetical protein
VRKILWTILGLWLGGSLVALHADTFALADGSSLTGDIVKSSDSSLTLRLPDDVYTNVLWTKFSQDALKQLAQIRDANGKFIIKQFVEPFIEIPASERPKKAEIQIKDEKDMSRLKLPANQSLLGALFSSSVGVVLLLLIYAANIYAGYEVAFFRSRPKGLVMGVSAVLPILGPIIFLALPSVAEPAPTVEEVAVAEAEPQRFAMPGAPPPDEIHIVAGSWTPPGTKPEAPEPQIFQRGQFTFNRRFFETKFPGFFGVVRRDADMDMVLIVKTMRGEFVVQRIARIGQDDVHFEIVKGEASYEEMVPFAEIQEIKLKHKDA